MEIWINKYTIEYVLIVIHFIINAVPTTEWLLHKNIKNFINEIIINPINFYV